MKPLKAVAVEQQQADNTKQETTMTVMNALTLGYVADALASEKRRELNDWVIQDRRAALAGANTGMLTTLRVAAGARLIRAGGWVGGPAAAPQLSRRLAR